MLLSKKMRLSGTWFQESVGKKNKEKYLNLKHNMNCRRQLLCILYFGICKVSCKHSITERTSKLIQFQPPAQWAAPTSSGCPRSHPTWLVCLQGWGIHRYCGQSVKNAASAPPAARLPTSGEQMVLSPITWQLFQCMCSCTIFTKYLSSLKKLYINTCI